MANLSSKKSPNLADSPQSYKKRNLQADIIIIRI